MEVKGNNPVLQIAYERPISNQFSSQGKQTALQFNFSADAPQELILETIKLLIQGKGISNQEN